VPAGSLWSASILGKCPASSACRLVGAGRPLFQQSLLPSADRQTHQSPVVPVCSTVAWRAPWCWAQDKRESQRLAMRSPSKLLHGNRAHAESHYRRVALAAWHRGACYNPACLADLSARDPSLVQAYKRRCIRRFSHTHSVIDSTSRLLLQLASLDKPSPRFKLQPTFSPAKLRCAISLLQTITPGPSISSSGSGCCPTAAPVLRTQLVHQADLQAASFLLQHLTHWLP
jgi:hypothetical protein